MPRILIIDEAMDLATLASNVSRNARTTEATLERVKALNPQLPAGQRLAAGTVLILPDSPDLKPGAGDPAGADSVANLGSRLRAGLRELESRAVRFDDSVAADHEAVRDALKPAAAKRLLESDPLLQKQLEAYETNFKAEAKRAAEVRAEMERTAKFVEAEMAKLQKLFG